MIDKAIIKFLPTLLWSVIHQCEEKMSAIQKTGVTAQNVAAYEANKKLRDGSIELLGEIRKAAEPKISDQKTLQVNYIVEVLGKMSDPEIEMVIDEMQRRFPHSFLFQ